MNLNTIAPLRVVINLQHRDDRRKHFFAESTSAKINAQRFSGINARWLKTTGGYPNKGHRALALTQKIVLRYAERKKAPAILILEDDVVFHPQIQEELDKISLPDDWGILLLGCCHIKPPTPIGYGIVRVAHAYDTHAMIIKAPYYRQVRKVLCKNNRSNATDGDPNDVQIAALHGEIPTYACYPNLAWQSKSRSNLRIGTNGNYSANGNQIWMGEIIDGLDKRMASFKPSRLTTNSSEQFTIPNDHPTTIGGVPKIIHQSWAESPPSGDFGRWMKTWKSANEQHGWVHWLWTDADLDNFVAEYYPDFLSTWNSYDKPIKKFDAARPLILKHYGGVYADMDTVCLKSLDEVVGKYSCFLGNQEFVANPLEHPEAVCNAFMGSSPNHPFWEGIDAAMQKSASLPVLDAAGPRFLTRWAVAQIPKLEAQDVPTILSLTIAFGLHWSDPARFLIRSTETSRLKRLFPDSLAVHFSTTTWV